jgi:hypothetical protein
MSIFNICTFLSWTSKGHVTVAHQSDWALFTLELNLAKFTSITPREKRWPITALELPKVNKPQLKQGYLERVYPFLSKIGMGNAWCNPLRRCPHGEYKQKITCFF